MSALPPKADINPPDAPMPTADDMGHMTVDCSIRRRVRSIRRRARSIRRSLAHKWAEASGCLEAVGNRRETVGIH
jgi:hypothetical protein